MIPFIQHLRPVGTTRNGSFNTDPKTESIANQLIQNGVRFEVEQLKSGKLYLSACKDDPKNGPVTIAIQLVKNSINEAVKLLVEDAQRYYEQHKESPQ